ncbi:hypothetical protein C6570_16795 [Ottowia oryzae]|uniref:Uncharacterized protein n=1 Tax=Ottowia oryzae TaxID=2109914 RepID=A0A2S0MIQ9_9BURK|nr:hypothetical protein C6570_16795 [Ottowia oryzae]
MSAGWVFGLHTNFSHSGVAASEKTALELAIDHDAQRSVRGFEEAPLGLRRRAQRVLYQVQ